MGGRGASSENNTKVISYQDMLINNQNVIYTLSMDKTVTIFETRGVFESVKTLPYNKVDYTKIDEAIVQVDKGMLQKREKQLKELGYKIKERTAYNKSDKPYTKILLHIKK